MAIKVDYSPVGTLLELAKTAGQGAGKRVRSDRAMRALSFALALKREQDQKRAQDRAFALQSAMASRIARTPTTTQRPQTGSAFDRMILQAAQAKQAQEEQMQQLDRMKESGVIDNTTYEQNKLRIIGNQSVRFPEVREPRAATIPTSVKRSPFTERIRTLRDEMDQVLQWKYAGNPEESPWGGQEGIDKQQARIQAQIDELSAQQQRAFGMTPSAEAPKSAPATPPGPGKWEGQKARNDMTGEVFEWQNGTWNKVSE